MSQLRQVIKNMIPASVKKYRFLRFVDHFAWGHEGIYNKDYYETHVEPEAHAAAKIMAETIYRRFTPKTLIDVGCGTGAFLEAVRSQGCGVYGLEYAEVGLAYCKKRGLPVRKFRIGTDEAADVRYDIATSFEVAEHLSPWLANKFVGLLCTLAPVVVMSGATPGQRGTDHINEQPHSYWIEKFRGHSYDFDTDATEAFRRAWKQAGIAWFYSDNVMCFTRH